MRLDYQPCYQAPPPLSACVHGSGRAVKKPGIIHHVDDGQVDAKWMKRPMQLQMMYLIMDWSTPLLVKTPYVCMVETTYLS